MAQQLSPPPPLRLSDKTDVEIRMALETILKYLERLRQEIDRRLTAGSL